MKKPYLLLAFSLCLFSTNAQTITEDVLLRRSTFSNYFGNNVASAGDINGDGFIDLIVGEFAYNSSSGGVHVFYGSINGFGTMPDWTYTNSNNQARLGWSVDGAGDINGDGYDDIIFGGRNWKVGSQNRGVVMVFYGASTGLASSPDWMKEGVSNGDTVGEDVAGVGDVNGDGYDDIIFSSPTSHYSKRGHVWLYYGASTGISSNFVMMTGTNPSMYLGRSLGSAGDVNGDGYNDIIVGGYGYEDSNIDGQVRVHYGSATGMTSMADWSYEGSNGEYAGYQVSGAGDVNGDGFDDIIFSGINSQKHQKLVLGSATGLSSSVNWNLANTDYPYSGNRIATKIGDMNGDGFADILAASSGSNGYIFLGSSSGPSNSYDLTVQNAVDENFGERVNATTLGDINADGIDDFVIGFPNYEQYYPSTGAVAIFYGDTFDNIIETSDWHVEGNVTEANMGHEVANAGDVNGDGWDDLLVSAWKYSNGHVNEGAAFLYYGNSSGLSDTPAWSAEGNQHNAYFGYSLSTAGDINNDGYSDIIIGAMGYDDGLSNSGRVYIYHGSSTGLSTSPDLVINGFQAQAYMGSDVADAGDVNGDGYADIVIGAYQFSNGEDKEGSAFVYLGSNTGIGITSKVTLDSDQSQAWFGKSVSTAGDINNDGYSDILIGAPKFDNGHTDEGKAFLYMGSSNGIIDSIAWSKEGNQYNAQFAFDVSWSGDNNNDGYDDIIIGAYGYDGISGSKEGRIFGFHGSATGLSNTANFEAFSQGNVNALGKALSFGGDFNNDGYDDIIVGAESTNSLSGAVLIYQGSTQGLDSIPYWTYEPNQTGAKFGASVSFAGDVNGDGVDDIVIGAPAYDHGHENEGGAFVFYGMETLISPPPSTMNKELFLLEKDGVEGFKVYPNPFQQEFYLTSEVEIISVKAISLNGQETSIGLKKSDKEKIYRAQTEKLSPQLYLLNILLKDGTRKTMRVLKR